MATRASLNLFLILYLLACSTVKSALYPLSRKDILDGFQDYKVVKHDLANQQPLTNPVTNPTATPVTPLQNPAPPIITVPATNPIGVVAPNPPVAQTSTPLTPVTNPVTTPTNPGAQPVTNPVTTPTTPSATTANPTTSAPPAVSGSGQSWCVAKSGLSQTAIQTALDYACGVGGVDCSAIQQNGSCYNPNTLQNHASFAFNAYYQKNPAPTSCDFGGAATVTNQNPSSGTCVFPTSSSTSASSGTPSTMPSTTPSNGATVPTGNTGSSSAPPNLLNSSSNYPPLGATPTGGITGSASPPADASDISLSNHLQAVLGYITLLACMAPTVLIY